MPWTPCNSERHTYDTDNDTDTNYRQYSTVGALGRKPGDGVLPSRLLHWEMGNRDSGWGQRTGDKGRLRRRLRLRLPDTQTDR